MTLAFLYLRANNTSACSIYTVTGRYKARSPKIKVELSVKILGSGLEIL